MDQEQIDGEKVKDFMNLVCRGEKMIGRCTGGGERMRSLRAGKIISFYSSRFLVKTPL